MGHAGNFHDSTIMEKHSFWKNREDIFPLGVRVIEGVEVPYLETGDSAFPITTRSIKPHTHNKLKDAEAYYNNRLSSLRMVVRTNIWTAEGKISNSLVKKRVLDPYCKCHQFHDGLLYFT